MLEELRDVRQPEGEPFRRWFRDLNMDLIIWYDLQGGILGFQLCYDKRTRTQYAVQWDREQGVGHYVVDDTPRYNPVLEETDTPIPPDLVERFTQAARRLDRTLAFFVTMRLEEIVGVA